MTARSDSIYMNIVSQCQKQQSVLYGQIHDEASEYKYSFKKGAKIEIKAAKPAWFL